MKKKRRKQPNGHGFLQHCAFVKCLGCKHTTPSIVHTRLKAALKHTKNALKICILINSYGYKLALDSNKTPFVSGKGVRTTGRGRGQKA